MVKLLVTILLILPAFVTAAIISATKCAANAQLSKVDNKTCECNEGYIGQGEELCVSFKRACESNACGPHSKCISDESHKTVKKFGAPFCICENHTTGTPPNCRIRCESSSECESDEFCDDPSCQKICSDDTCGPNSICTVKDREAHCTCQDHYVPKSGENCQLSSSEVFFDDKNTLCSLYCAENANCEVIDRKVYCSCRFVDSVVSNPFVECQNASDDIIDRVTLDSGELSLCDCCSQNLKPGCEMPINPAVIKTLLG